MSRFLFTVWPFQSHYFPMVAMAHVLRERGHEVAFYTGSQARPTLESEGFVCFPFEAVDEERVDELMFSRAAYASWRMPLQLRTLLREWLLGTVPDQLRDLTPILKSWAPDALVCETSMWGPMLVLHEKHSIPVAVFSTVIACLLPGSDVPLVGLGLPRPRSWHTRLLARAARSTVSLLSSDFRRAVNSLRKSHGLQPLDVSVTEFSGRMPLYLEPSVPETAAFALGSRGGRGISAPVPTASAAAGTWPSSPSVWVRRVMVARRPIAVRIRSRRSQILNGLQI